MLANHIKKPFLVNKFMWLLGCILVVNIVQACSSALLNDEPYYWIYAKYLSWGYFDHPPMIAFLIKLGSTIVGGEIGVRLFPLLLGSGTFYLICKIIAGEAEINFKLLALLLFSSLFLNLYSFLAIPDTPLLFFGTLFLYLYRRYLDRDNIANAALLGLITALLLYAKYHGILIVLFTVMSNPQLLRRRSFYLIAIIALVLYAPHIYWEMQHDYPTIRFQFAGRTEALGIQHTLSYLGEQAAVTGPVILLLFSILYRPKNQFQKTLKYNVIGVFIFFLISSVKAMVNVHWTAIAWPPMLCLSYLYIDKLTTVTKLVYGLLVINLVAVIVLRLNLSLDWFRIPNFNDKNPKMMASILKGEANGRPLVFDNTYNEPSYYAFYTGQECFAVNDIWYKKTQYNYLPGLEQKFQDKTVAYVSDGAVDKTSRPIVIPREKKYYLTFINHFTSFTGVNVRILNTVSDLKSNEKATFHVSIDASQPEIERLKSTEAFLILTFTNNKTQVPAYYTYPLLEPINGKPFKLTFKAPPPGSYRYQFSVVAKQHIGVGFNSNIYHCKVN
ncbi:ArnT family glycosyltransferase [Mucilaginibacter panaciglaebae]|uniref:Glycosyltransferase RgtA/B/C/D-like domain-containing protein n=1 Tax=Mucilaginibacter panaciglaebae TaxID=502331 RepID=A0ABP7WXY9_9SPHI